MSTEPGELQSNFLRSRTIDGATTQYRYDANERLERIIAPDGTVKFGYDNEGRVTAMTRVTDAAADTGPTTTFAYYGRDNLGICPAHSAGRTIETRPDGAVATHCYDTSLAPLDAPVVTAEGQLLDLADGFDARTDLLGVYGDASDPQGIQKVELLVDRLTRATSATDCAGGCPTSHRGSLIVAGPDLSEGRHQVQVVATDMTGQTGMTKEWSIAIDRTPPSATGGLRADWDATRGMAQLSWAPANDPLLADGTTGAGIDGYEWRIVQLDGTWSEWRDVDVDEPGFVSRQIGDSVRLAVRASDNAGNVSAVAEATVTVGSGPPPLHYDLYNACPTDSSFSYDVSCFTAAPDTATRAQALPRRGECVEYADDPRQVDNIINDDNSIWSFNGKRILGRVVRSSTEPPYHDVFSAVLERASVSMSGRRPQLFLAWDKLCGRDMRGRITVRVYRFRSGGGRVLADQRSYPTGTFEQAQVERVSPFYLHHSRYEFRIYWKYDTQFYGNRRGSKVRSYRLECEGEPYTDDARCQFDPLYPGSPRQ